MAPYGALKAKGDAPHVDATAGDVSNDAKLVTSVPGDIPGGPHCEELASEFERPF